MSLFDTPTTEVEDDDDSKDEIPKDPSSRKFTGQSSFFAGPRNGTQRGPPVTPREQMRQREFNLVSGATSPAAFLFQASLILALLGLVIYVGATGQLGMNNDYEDDYYNYDPTTVLGPERTVQASTETVWL